MTVVLLGCSKNNGNFNFSSDQLWGDALPKLLLNVWGEDGINKRGTKPEAVVENFVELLAEGECEKALKSTMGTARESLMAAMDVGCEGYETRIVATECETENDVANCECTEVRTGMEMTYLYTLRKIGKKWKVEEYKKDMDLDLKIGFEEEPESKENNKTK